LKKGKENSTGSSSNTFRKQDLDDTAGFSGVDLNNSDPGAGDDDNIHFDFDENDVEKYRKQSQDKYQGRDGGADARVYRKQDLDTRMDINDDGHSAKKPQKKGLFRQKKEEQPYEPGIGDTVIVGMANKKQTNKEIRRMAYVMIALMFCVIAYIVYFDAVGRRNVVNNPNNSLLAKLEEKVARGSILSSDGKTLAKSAEADDGSYYRSYPFSNIFAHVVGTSDINKSGIEQTADYDLVTSDIQPVEKIINEIKGVRNPGNNVVTTLDSSLQKVAYDELGDSDGAVVALDPKTGKVLAMVSKPDYDPNTLAKKYKSILKDSSSKVLLNQATQGLFVPGSIFKIVTTLAYLRSGHDPDKYSYNCDGSISLATDSGTKHSISCYDGEVHGKVDLTTSFAESCNSSFANIGQSITVAEMNSVCDDLLFNRSLPTAFKTATSVFSLKDSDSKWTIGATAIGQGSTQISPLHAAMLVSAIANGGELMEPYVIDKVVSADGNTVRKNSSVSAGELMSSSEVKRLQKMMRAVVTEGTGYKLQNKSYSSAGKTGTAEVSGKGNNAWFVGYAPADDPQIVVCVLLEDSGTASTSAVPIAGALFDEYFSK